MTSPMKRQSQFKSIPSLIATLLVAFAGLAKAGSSAAAEPPAALSKKVTYADLNLDSQQGANALYVRLRRAAEDVCEPFDSKELSRHSMWRMCVRNALTSAVAQVNKPKVTALHNQSVNHSGSNGNS
jgi:UrcA family protein